MKKQITKSINEHFGTLADPRDEERIEHKLFDMLVIAICAIVGGANDWEEVVVFGEAKASWFAEFLELPHGIPSYSTFWRLFRHLDAEQFERCFAQWTGALCELSEGEVVAIDGKQCRRSHDRRADKEAICLVSAWASANGLTLGQVKTDAKSNEIRALPALLELLDLQDCIVTIDAMGCQTDIAETIVEQGGDYLLALKQNQGTLCETAYSFSEIKTVDKDHGRIEVRRCWTVSDPQLLANFRTTDRWAGLQSIVKVETKRYLPNGEQSVKTRYFISSLDADAQTLLKAIRTH